MAKYTVDSVKKILPSATQQPPSRCTDGIHVNKY